MGYLVMSEKERRRKALFEMVKQGCLTLIKAAQQADLSYRQAKRLYRACKKLGICIIKAYSPQAKGRVERKHMLSS